MVACGPRDDRCRRSGGAGDRGSSRVSLTAQPWSGLAADLAQLQGAERDAAEAFLAAHRPGVGAPLAVVIPAYNEAPTVAAVIAGIPASAAGLPAEVIVVVDGAKDATVERATEAGGPGCGGPGNPGPG